MPGLTGQAERRTPAAKRRWGNRVVRHPALLSVCRRSSRLSGSNILVRLRSTMEEAYEVLRWT
jgi:hypothetical protein